MKLFIFLMLFLLSASVVGVEVMAPILTDGRLTSVIPAQRLLESWVISMFSLAGLINTIGKEDARRALLASAKPTNKTGGNDDY